MCGIPSFVKPPAVCDNFYTIQSDLSKQVVVITSENIRCESVVWTETFLSWFLADVLRRFSRHIFRRIFVLNSTLEESLRQTSEERRGAPRRQVSRVVYPFRNILTVLPFGISKSHFSSKRQGQVLLILYMPLFFRPEKDSFNRPEEKSLETDKAALRRFIGQLSGHQNFVAFAIMNLVQVSVSFYSLMLCSHTWSVLHVTVEPIIIFIILGLCVAQCEHTTIFG